MLLWPLQPWEGWHSGTLGKIVNSAIRLVPSWQTVSEIWVLNEPLLWGQFIHLHIDLILHINCFFWGGGGGHQHFPILGFSVCGLKVSLSPMCKLPSGLRYLQLYPTAVFFPAKLLGHLAFVSFPHGLVFLNNCLLPVASWVDWESDASILVLQKLVWSSHGILTLAQILVGGEGSCFIQVSP